MSDESVGEITEEIQKVDISNAPPKKETEFGYICPKCNKPIRYKYAYIKHLARKRPCYEVRDIHWLRKHFGEQPFQEYLDGIENLFTDFEALTQRAKNLEDIHACRKALLNIKKRVPQMKARVRAICHEKGNISLYDADLNKYDERLKDITDKYLLLLI